MGASIYWEPATKPTNHVNTAAPQAFIRSLEPLGWVDGGILTDITLPALRALATTVRNQDPDENPYLQLAEAIEKHGSIRVWAIY